MTAADGAGDESPVVYDLDDDCTPEDVEEGVPYLARVNGVVEYGVFVDLCESVSGLVHESTMEREYAVGDELVVELERRREDGDLAFAPADADLDDAELERVGGERDVATADDLEGLVGETVALEGRVAQINQTGGPTIFQLRDESGIVPCAAFAGAGVRAYPEIEVGDHVRASGTVERREGGIQLEADDVDPLDEEAAAELAERIDAAIEEAAEPHDVDPLVEWDAMASLYPDLRDVATLLRRSILEGRPVRIRHHADGDGMCASVPLQRALERLAEEVHADPDAPRHLLRRLPSKAPFYEMEDATRDLAHALEDRSRHGQRLPLLLMLDNGSTAEDTPAYETLRHYDVPIVVLDHHHPDPDAVEPLVARHVNPYLHGEDYRVTTGMMCVELARMIDPDLSDRLEHVPAVAGLADRSGAEAMERYLELAAEAGYDEEDVRAIGEALDYAAHWLRYDAGRHVVDDVIGLGEDADRHRELVEVLAERARDDVDEQLEAALPHVEREGLPNGADLYRIDLEDYAHRFTYPAPGKTTGAIHDHMVETEGDPAITIGYGPDFAVLRSDGVRLDIPTMVAELEAELDGGVSGGGHLVVGSIKFVKGRRDEVIDRLVEKMADADVDEEIGSTTGGLE